MTEKELRPVVTKWLEQMGYYVAHEVMLCGYCDVIACLWGERETRKIPTLHEIIAVELKISDIQGVLSQARNNKYCAHRSVAAMPFDFTQRMRPSSIKQFEDAGVGLLGVNDSVHWVVIPKTNLIGTEIFAHKRRNLWNFKVRHEATARAKTSNLILLTAGKGRYETDS
jgi:hypothetical protein